jgi:hypothetical protein
MSEHARTFARGLLAGTALAGALSLSALAAGASPPVFTENPSAGWFSYTRQWIAPPTGPGPVRQDPKYPLVSNDEYRATGRQPTFAMGDASNPILQPWAAEALKKRNELTLSGTPAYSLHASCWPVGIPTFLLMPMTRPMYIVQGAKEVVMILTSFSDVRRIYLADKHSADLKPSWHGDSIGHYEGDTLVVDTVGIKTGRFSSIDRFGTPYTEKMHVVERYRFLSYEAAKEVMARGEKEWGHVGAYDIDPTYRGRGLQLEFQVEDPGVFTMPWTATVTYLRSINKEWEERACAENVGYYYAGVTQYYSDKEARIPTADKPDF